MTGRGGRGGAACVLRRSGLEIAALAAMAAILAWQLIVPPPVGLADNGDFARLAGPLGLRATVTDPAQRYFGHVPPGFRLSRPFWRSRYVTSEIVPIAVARAIGAAGSRTGFVDVRVFGAVNALFALAGAAVLLAGSRRFRAAPRVVLAALVVFVYSDVGYAAPMSSLYSQTAALWTFLFLAGFALLAAARPTAAALCGYWIAAFLFVTAKPQEIVQTPLLALLGVALTRVAGVGASRGWRPWAIAAALCAAAGVCFLRVPKRVSAQALENEVFVEILGRSPYPSVDLRELGLPAGWIAYRGMNPNDPGSPFAKPAFESRFLRQVTPGRVVRFWAHHPRRAARLVDRCLATVLQMRPPELGNFRASDGMPPLAKSRAFSLWSEAKRRANPLRRLLVTLVLLLTAGAGAFLGRPGRKPEERALGLALAVLAGMAALELAVPPFAQGAWGIERVLFGFHVLFDFCLISLATLAAAALSSRAASRRAVARA